MPAANGNFTIDNVPARGYPSFLFKAPGYDTLVRPITVPDGGFTTLVARLRRNWAARAGGASATGDQPYAALGCGVGRGRSTRARRRAGWSTMPATPAMIDHAAAGRARHRFGIDPTAACGIR